MSLNNCRLIELPKVIDVRGNLVFAENSKHIPFDIKRVFYLYGAPVEAKRGGHAHKKLSQFLIPIVGSFDVVLDDGAKKQTFHLDKPFVGLNIEPMVWNELGNFSSGSVCLVLASDLYDEEDYYRNYQQFLTAINKNGKA